LPLGDDLHFIGLCGFSNLLFFLYADERRAFLKWLWGLVIFCIIVGYIEYCYRRPVHWAYCGFSGSLPLLFFLCVSCSASIV